MEAVRTSETSVNIYFTTWQYIPEECKLHFLYFHGYRLRNPFSEVTVICP
jgi:hypothetical protein